MSPILSQTMTKEKYEKLAKDFPLAKSIFITKNIQGSSGFCGQAIGNAVAHASLHPHTHICLFRGIPAFLRDNRPTNVLLHEYAHVIVLETHHLDAKSHGHEWRFEFKKLLIKYKYPHNEADLSMYSPWRYLTPPRFHILFKRTNRLLQRLHEDKAHSKLPIRQIQMYCHHPKNPIKELDLYQRRCPKKRTHNVHRPNTQRSQGSCRMGLPTARRRDEKKEPNSSQLRHTRSTP